MTDVELAATWPNLGTLVSELRRLERAELADRLVDSVQYASTSGEIYSDVGNALTEYRAVRRSLSGAASAAWEGVMEDIERAYGMPGVMRWLMRMWRRL
jgi:hypothetical protein